LKTDSQPNQTELDPASGNPLALLRPGLPWVGVSFFVALVLSIWLSFTIRSSAGTVDRSAGRYEEEVLPVLAAYCYDCHGDGSSKGDVELDGFTSYEELLEARDLWEGVDLHLRSHTMPPEKKEQPTIEERALLAGWIDEVVFHVDPKNPDPGKVVVRRLNRTEYDRVIHDVFGLDLKIAARNFPPDDTGHGYDTVADVLSLPPLLFEKYYTAAEDVTEAAILTAPREGTRTKFKADEFHGGGFYKSGRSLHFSSNAEAKRKIKLKESGMHRFRILASATRGGEELAKMRVRLGDQELGHVAVEESLGSEGTYEFEYENQKPGQELELRIAFTNDWYKENVADRNLMVRDVEHVASPPPASSVKRTKFQDWLYGEVPAPDASEKVQQMKALEAVAKIGRRLFRRPLTSDEKLAYARLYDLERVAGEPFEDALRAPITAMLVSPRFLFRGEQIEPGVSTEGSEGEVREISEYDLASRLSFFLWSSCPDDRLLDLAEQGQLRKQLREETDRLLDDPRSAALVSNFGGQWLHLRDLELMGPDEGTFPHYDEALARDLKEETERFLASMIAENRPLADLVLAEETWVNERVAKHYGLDGVKGEEFRKVSLRDTPRRGILGHASVLVVTSNPTRTSPVGRGKFVLESLLGTPSPPAPQNIEPLAEEPTKEEPGTLRERLERHREDSSCAACHRLLDPPGFALENFDATGRWRTEEDGAPVDASGELLEGEQFTGLREFTQILADTRRDEMARGISEHLFVYALGRGVTYKDKTALRAIEERLRENEYRFRELIYGLVESVPFQKTR